ncbi:AAA family ATPase [Azonexus sp. IMCC34839]|uniref:AAA family ATPase n=1 Tax=Azonexus sp. IMCC34839 TaxID=3133695 RepID=UPI00399AECFD
MKITNITASNFLGASAVNVHLSKPVALIAGKNGAGKSSLQEAIRMALTGETVRVGLKKDYGSLVTDGQESGFVEVETADTSYSVVLPSGKGIHSDNATLSFVLDAQRFAHMDDKERRTFLFGLIGIKLDGQSVKDRLVAKGCNADKVERIMPILRAGFDAAQKEAASKARDAKASWKTSTGGETWGKEKAAAWQPAPLEFDASTADDLLKKTRLIISADDEDIGRLQQEIGAARAETARRQQAESRRAELHAKAEKIGRIQDKLSGDTAELAAWEEKVAITREKAGAVPANPKAPGEFLLRGLATVTAEFLALSNDYPDVDWPSELLNRAATHHAEYVKLHGDPVGNDAGPDPEAVAKLPEYEAARDLMLRSVANDKRDLEDAKAAKAEYDKLIAEQGKPLPDIEVMQAKLREITARRDAARADERKYSDMASKAAGRAALVEQVAKLHQDVTEWTAISDALAPDGIPSEILADELGPINERLRLSAANAQWEPAQINADMSITYGLRDYAMISESEKWRADAMIAEAVSFMSGIKLLVLDRFDVLDLTGREDLLYWLDGIASDGDIDTALVFGTLKALPSLGQFTHTTEAFWIENGMTGQLKQAA